MSLSAHQSAHMKNDEWLTPPSILSALGEFDLDPCAPIVRPWDTAKHHYTLPEDGLSKPWFGRIWLNPPFGRHAVKWLRKLRDHGNGIALIPARTETAMFYETVWGGRRVCYLSRAGRISITSTDAGHPSTAAHPLPSSPMGKPIYERLSHAALGKWSSPPTPPL